VYTAALNLVDILFLALVAGPLMRRFGLRLELLLNPIVVAGVLAVMVVVAAGPGAAAFGLFVLAGVLRIADIAATDGTTRTSINAAYQIVPIEERLAVQAVVEGIGVPVAIGATGVLLLALNVLDLGTGAVIAFGLVLGLIWTAIAVSVYRSYTRALAEEMRRRSLVASGFDFAEDDAAAVRALLRSDDARDVRLGLDLLAGVTSPASDVELRHVAEHATRRFVCARSHSSQRTATRVRPPTSKRSSTISLTPATPPIARGGSSVRVAGSGGHRPRRAALPPRRPRPVGASRGSRRRPAGRFHRPGGRPSGRRSGRGAAHRRQRDHRTPAARRRSRPPPRRRAGPRRRTQTCLARPGGRRGSGRARGRRHWAGASELRPRGGAHRPRDARRRRRSRVVPAAVLDDVFHDASSHAGRALAARVALAGHGDPLTRALDDEIDLARELVIDVLALRHGDRIREAVRVVDHGDGARRALGVEALDVAISREEAAVALPLVRRDRTGTPEPAPSTRTPEEWIADIAGDPEAVWRSPWLALCARHVAGA
jgi:hypothetical protein